MDIFNGEEGHGKTLYFMSIVCRIIGPVHSMVTSNKELVFGKFTKAIENMLMCVLDEVQIGAGKKKAQSNESGVLRNLVTSKTRESRHMYSDPDYNHRNLTNFASTSNYGVGGSDDVAIGASNSARRFACYTVDTNPLMTLDCFKQLVRALFAYALDGCLHYHQFDVARSLRAAGLLLRQRRQAVSDAQSLVAI